jgi:signal transduction histidine kinase
MSQSQPIQPNGFEDHAAMRAAIRRDMLRTNTAVALVLVAVLALALVAVFAGLRAARNLERAEAAEADGRERLRKAYTAQAGAMRATAQAGGREAALTSIRNAAAIGPSPDTRTEAIACLAQWDLVQEGPLLPTPNDLGQVLMDSDLRYYACVDASNNAAVFGLKDGKEVCALAIDSPAKGGWGAPADLTWSPNGQLLAGRYEHAAVAVWDVATRRAVFRHGFGATNPAPPGLSLQSLRGLSFSPDSQQLIFSDGEELGQVSVYDIASGQKRSSAVRVWGKMFRMRPDMKQVAVVTGNQVNVLEYPSGRKLHTLAHGADVAWLQWAPDGNRLAVSCDDGEVYLWELEREMYRHLSGHSERCVRLGFSPDGKLLFSSSRDGTSRLWDVAQGRMIAAGQGLADTFTPDGTRLGFWRAWEGFGVWRVSKSSVYSALRCDKAEGPLFTLDLSPSGRWCVATQSKGFRVWDLSMGDQESYIPLPDVFSIRISPDEKALYVCTQSGLEAWPLPAEGSGKLQMPPVDPRRFALPGDRGARAIALSSDGHWAAVELTDRRLIEINLTEQQPPVVFQGRWTTANFKGPASQTGAGRFAISPDGRWVVTGYGFNDDTPTVWNGQTGESAARLKAGTSVVCFSPDGRWLGLAGMDRFSIWSVGDWGPVKEFRRDESSVTHGAMAFTQDSTMLAVSQTRQMVQLRDAPTDQPLGNLIPPAPQSVNSLRLAWDGSILATATASDMVEIWRLGNLRRQLAAMNLDWGGPPNSGGTAPPVKEPDWVGWQTTFVASVAGVAVAVGFSLLTLRRHRVAIERFVIAEAQAAKRDRDLNLAGIELVQSHKMQALGTLAAGIAHDFNNLLSVVRMSNKLIGRQTAGDADIQEHVADIEQAVLQGKSVVSSLLGYARDRTDDNEPADVSAAVEDAVSLLSREFLSGIALTLELEPDAPKVKVGRGPLDQILLNLLVNASEAMQGEGRLEIVVRARAVFAPRNYVLRPGAASEFVELTVKDSGPGIAPELMDRLFEPFFTTKRSGSKPGTGLGLSLVYAIAKNGELGLSVQSDASKGATFSLVMPAARSPVRQTHTSQIANPA